MAMRNALARVRNEVTKWPEVTAYAHRFGGVEFRLGRRELGHVHGDYQVDMPLPMNLRNQLVAEGKVEPHHVLPKSGWITLRFRTTDDVDRAIGLFRLSYELAAKKAKP